MKTPLLVLILLLLFSVVACGANELNDEQVALNYYMNEMRGGASPGLLDQGNTLRTQYNEAVADWQTDQTNPEFPSILDGLIKKIDLHVDKLGKVGIAGELRSIHNIYINGWREWETAAKDLRLYLTDPANSSLLSSFSEGLLNGEATFRDYVVEIQNYRSEIE